MDITTQSAQSAEAKETAAHGTVPIDFAEAEAGREAESEDPGLIGIMDLFVPLIRRRRLLLFFTLGGLLLGGLWTLRRGIYVATTTVLPPQSSVGSGLLGQMGGLAGLMGSAGLGIAHGGQDLYVALLQTPTVLDAVVRRFDLERLYDAPSVQAARVELIKHCVITASPTDGMISISVHDDTDPKRAAEIANGYVEEFIKFMSHLAVTEAGQRRLFFEEQMQKEKAALNDAEDNLRKTEVKTGAVQLNAQTQALVTSAANLRALVAAKQVEVESIRAYAGPANINLQRAEQELAELKSQLAGVSNSTEGDSMAVSRNALPQTTLDNLRAQREVKYHEGIFSILSNQYEAARLDEAREGVPVQIVEPATAPESRSAKPVYIKLTVPAVLGLFAGIVYVLVAYAWYRMRANRMFAGKLSELHDAYTSKA